MPTTAHDKQAKRILAFLEEEFDLSDAVEGFDLSMRIKKTATIQHIYYYVAGGKIETEIIETPVK
jgi:hypothetical protein